MVDAKTAPYAALMLRLSMGILFILHGVYLKVFVFTMAGAAGFFQSLGLPGWFAWLVMLYETIGGVGLILGIYARPIAAFLGIHLLFAAYLGHGGSGGCSRTRAAAGNTRCSGPSPASPWRCSATAPMP